MVFARCLAVESDLFFTSTSARTTISSRATTTHHSSKHEQRPSSASTITTTETSPSIMPTFLNWTRKSSNSSNGRVSTAKSPGSNNNSNNNQEPSPGRSHHRHHKHRHSKTSDAGNNENKVTYHRGEKSFLAFHQNYAITRHLGEGSYSTVKQVTHRKRGGLFACKIVDKTALSAVDRVALSQEVQVLAKVRHDQIMKLYEVIEDDTKCYLIMELAEHGDLFDKIVKQGKFPEQEAQKVTAALCEALAYCHSNAIIHRDVKPENVLLSNDPHAIKLCDFGFAKQLADVNEKSVDSCGTPGYAAPEILDGKPYGVEVDVFSLGVVTYIMLCGYPPFPMKLSQLRTHRFNVRFPSKDWAHIDASVKEMITKMLHVKPDLRPKMSELQKHPWIQRGKQTLDELREQAEQRQREEALQRKQLIADTIRKKLTSTTGFEVVKHGRQGQPHRTKLRLSPDGRVLSWQPKLLKRGLLKYHQNAKSFTSFFGFGGSSSKSDKQVVAHPQISRLSTLEATRSSERDSGGRHSEPILCEDSTHSAIMQQETNMAMSFSGGSQPHLSKTDSTNSTTSTGSASWIDKKNWWRSFRRSPEKPKANGTTSTERSASGGFSCAAFSLTNTSPPPPASRSLSSSSSCSVVSDSNETADHTNSRLSFASTGEPSSPKPLSPGSSPTMSLGTTMSMGSIASPPLSPTASATTERMLDTSINLKDIRSVTLGEDSQFFQALTGNDCCQCNERGCPTERTAAKTTSATDSGCDGSDGEGDDVHDAKKRPSSELNIAAMLTVATRYRELHLEFPSEELRDAFAFLLEQATLPLEEVSQHQHSFIFRSSATPTPLELDEPKSDTKATTKHVTQPQDNNDEHESEEAIHNNNNDSE